MHLRLISIVILFISSSNFAQKNCDSVITKELQLINDKLQLALDSKDCAKVDGKLKRENDDLTKELKAKEELNKQKDKEILVQQQKVNDFSTKYDASLRTEKTLNDTIKKRDDEVKKLVTEKTTLLAEKTTLETEKRTWEGIQTTRNAEIDAISNELKTLLSTKQLIDPIYLSLATKTLKEDKKSEGVLLQVETFLKNQDALNEIDSLMKIVTFTGFKEAKDKLEKIMVAPDLKAQVKRKSDLLFNLGEMGNIIELYRQSNIEYSTISDEYKYSIKIYSKLKKLEEIYPEFYKLYPCLYYQFIRLIENRKTYVLPSTN
jgi:hypothetical protein